MSEPLLRLEGVASGYGDVRVLWGVDLDVEPGEVVCLVGANGAGKSTLLRTVSGLVRATAGRVLFRGRDLARATPAEVLAAGIAQVPEGRRLFAAMSVRNNLLMGAYLRRDGAAAIQRDLELVYTVFPTLAERRRQDAGTLSGGEQQMCAIGRGFMSRPALLMIDELSLGLAPRLVERLGEALREINRAGISILLVEQDVMTAFELARRGFVLDAGRVTLHGPTSELARNPTVREAYMGLAP
ncbi:MAG: branched-chain amino acid ABC transporter ATP-binding protein [Betaproteobacteria bacterium RIFCSPLOWO2_12_FULL_66_14]|nr:MAG: branched-chain amino acid ABC transporter ATP-binding protein [Betaproteobacteria bacterium RIFCSPLOWO2_12_FULL_66_14]